MLWSPVTEGNNRERNGDVESSAHKLNGRRIHQAYVAAPALSFRARIRSSPHSPGTPLPPSPPLPSLWICISIVAFLCRKLKPLSSTLLSDYILLLLIRVMMIGIVSQSKFKFSDTEYIMRDFWWQISTEAEAVASRLHKSGLLRTQGLIGGKWVDAYDRKTIKVSHKKTTFLGILVLWLFFSLVCYITTI
jgi:hypothetical protein